MLTGICEHKLHVYSRVLLEKYDIHIKSCFTLNAARESTLSKHYRLMSMMMMMMMCNDLMCT